MTQQNSIEIVKVPLTAGTPAVFALSGEYFEIINAVDPVDVILSDVNGAQRARLIAAEASFFSKGVSFGVIQLKSATSQIIEIAYGSGETGTRRSTGSTTIAGTVALHPTSIAPVPTGWYASTAALGANNPDPIFAPAANPNGTLLLGAYAQTIETPGHVTAFIAKAGPAPTGITDGMIVAGSIITHNGTTSSHAIDLDTVAHVPPGMGLYFICNVAITAALAYHYRAARWRTL